MTHRRSRRSSAGRSSGLTHHLPAREAGQLQLLGSGHVVSSGLSRSRSSRRSRRHQRQQQAVTMLPLNQHPSGGASSCARTASHPMTRRQRVLACQLGQACMPQQ